MPVKRECRAVTLFLFSYIYLCYLRALLFFYFRSPVTRRRFIIFEMESHHVYLSRVTVFVVFTRRADRKLSLRTSSPILNSTGIFYPYVVTCAFPFFFSLPFLFYIAIYNALPFFLISELRASPTPAQSLSGTSESASTQRMLRVSAGSASVWFQLACSGSSVGSQRQLGNPS